MSDQSYCWAGNPGDLPFVVEQRNTHALWRYAREGVCREIHIAGLSHRNHPQEVWQHICTVEKDTSA